MGAYPPGLHALGLSLRRDAYLYVPSDLSLEPAPLLVLCHGAGADAQDILRLATGLADERRFLILAPQSQGRTWDIILGNYGPDIEALDAALAQIFEHHRVDSARTALSGFSDGASYALSVGLMNGDLFGDILAFSPGFMAPIATVARPRIFLSHGTRDQVLPIERCGRRLAAMLGQAGYDIDYREFEGGHSVPPEMVAAGVVRFLAGS